MNSTVNNAVAVGTVCTIAAVVITNVALAAPQLKARYYNPKKHSIKHLLHIEA